MKAIIPVAGHGTRLEPHSLHTQKCLLPVAGKPVLAHILDNVVDAGITEVTLIVGHHASHVIDFCNSLNSELKFNFVEQTDRLGLGHAISLGLEDINEPVLILLGDSIYELDYSTFMKENENTIGVFEVPDPQRFGIVETESTRITKFVEKPEFPKSNLAIAGIYGIRSQKTLLTSLQYLFNNDIKTKDEYQLTDALQHMLENDHPFMYKMIDNCLDCGIPETLLETNKILLARKSNNVIHQSAEVANSELLNTTIMENCKVDNAELNNVIVLSGATVKGCKLENQIIGHNQVLEAVI